MKILVIDPHCPRGHINFNKIHISAIENVADEVEYIFRGEFNKEIGVPDSKVVYKLSVNENRRRKIDSLILNRLKSIKDYWDIRKFIRNKKYDAFIFLCYDELVFPILGKTRNVYLINHTNLASFCQSQIKRFFYKRISKTTCQLVFDENCGELLSNNGIKNYKIVPHGLVDGFSQVGIPNSFSKYTHLIFSPSRGSIDDNLLKKIIEDKELQKFLEEKNILLFVRSENLQNSHGNIMVKSGHLTEREYQGLINNASIILLPYPSSFQYRTSGVVMEGIANNKRLLVSDIPAFRVYEKILGSGSYFTPDSYLNDIKRVIKNIENQGRNVKYTHTEFLNPNYEFLKHD